MNLKIRIKTLEQKLLNTMRGSDKIDLEKWNSHSDKLEFVGWETKDNPNKEVKNELKAETEKN